MFESANRVVIRSANLSDVKAIIDIQTKCYLKNYVNQKYKATEKQILELDWEGKLDELKLQINNQNNIGFVAEIDHLVIDSIFLVDERHWMNKPKRKGRYKAPFSLCPDEEYS